MITDEELDGAVTAGALSADAAQALRRHVAAQRHLPEADEEHFRLLTGFNDLFVVIAGLLVLTSLRWLLNLLVMAPLGDLAMSAAAWGLAEFFVRRRRQALPAIVLTLAWLVGLVQAALVMLAHPLAWPAAALVACAAAVLHWRRFQVPITWAAAVAVVALALFSGLPDGWQRPSLALTGLATLVAAIRWDMSDRLRRTRRADVAFWLHLLAAPLLVHPLFTWLSETKAVSEMGAAGVVLAGYAVLAWASLVLDRRALMVSALGYVVLVAVVAVRRQVHSEVGLLIVPLGIGVLLLLLSAFWEQARRRAVALLPQAWAARLAPTRGAAV